MLNCKDATYFISKAQDRSLPLAEKLALEVHLLMCSGCRRYREQTNCLRTLCQQHPAQPRLPGDAE